MNSLSIEVKNYINIYIFINDLQVSQSVFVDLSSRIWLELLWKQKRLINILIKLELYYIIYEMQTIEFL